MNAPLIEAQGLRKRFRGPAVDVDALVGLDLRVRAGEVVGLLGGNGAGKSTTLRILATVLPADGGQARIAGHDVATEAMAARARLGYVSQAGGVDDHVTGRQNLVFQGRLHGLDRRAVAGRAGDLLDGFGLTPIADTSPRTWSGGQRRRLALALGLIHRPQVLLLDEPTVGLDPPAKVALWQRVADLAATGAAVLLSTHDIEEVNRLCHRRLIIERGALASATGPSAW